jgi:DNA-binding PadR family transcriptional regulator
VSLKHAVLALIAERRGYGYDLVQRLEQRLGVGWQLKPSAIYPALDQLERAGLVTAREAPRGTRRSPRVVYAATPAGAAALDAWLRTTTARVEPIRSELHLRVAFTRPEHEPALAAHVAATERACEELLARCAARRERSTASVAAALIDAAVVARLQGELAWLREVRAALA